MGMWSRAARMMDFGGAWKLSKMAKNHGGFFEAFRTYFGGYHMGNVTRLTSAFAPVVERGTAISAARQTLSPGYGRMAMRIGVPTAGLIGLGIAARHNETVNRFMGTTVPIAAGIGMYAGAKYGLGRYARSGLGDAYGFKGLASNRLYSRGLATLAGAGTWYGLR